MHRALTAASMVATILASAPAAYAADYAIDPTHSHIMFMIDHLGFARSSACSAHSAELLVSIPTMFPLANST